ncbi:hypothetical protein Dda_7986 [Drechslerella dactyloides]|uniref:Uncharacterized protein n=1 Tax=Drechslerella dactyloides TaxID=74499 RepID=A0AAD6IUP6_DREDA|nr:hypothetical protein Dda_7986 [Drechslerella dactyloides]
MLRLGSSHILLTNRDASRSLHPNRTRRQPTSLYTKGKKPVRASARLAAMAAAAASAAMANSSASTASPDTYFSQSDRLLPSSSTTTSTHRRSARLMDHGPINWPPAPEEEGEEEPTVATDATDPSIEEPPMITAVDGADEADEEATSGFEEYAGLRQVISLATVDSFPFLPISTRSNFEIYEDPDEDEDTAVEDSNATHDEEMTDVDSWGERDDGVSDQFSDDDGDGFGGLDGAAEGMGLDEVLTGQTLYEYVSGLEAAGLLNVPTSPNPNIVPVIAQTRVTGGDEGDDGGDEEEESESEEEVDEDNPRILVETIWDPNTVAAGHIQLINGTPTVVGNEAALGFLAGPPRQD